MFVSEIMNEGNRIIDIFEPTLIIMPNGWGSSFNISASICFLECKYNNKGNKDNKTNKQFETLFY